MFLQAERSRLRSRLRPAICFYKRNRSRLRPAISFYKRNGLAFAPPSTPPSSRYMFLQAGRSRLRSRLRPAMRFHKRHSPAFDSAFAPLCVFTSGTVPPSAPPLSCFRSRLRPASSSGTVPLSIPPSPRYVSLPAERSRLPPRLRPAFGPAFVPLSVFTSGAVPPSIAPSSRYMSLPAARSRLRSRLRPAKCFYKRNGPALVSWTLLGSLGCPGFSWAVLGSPWLAWSLLGWGSPGLSWALLGSLGPWALLGCLGLSRARGLFGAPLGSLCLLGSPGLSGLSWAFIEIGRCRGYLKDCAINRFGRVSTCSDPAAAARKPQTEF